MRIFLTLSLLLSFFILRSQDHPKDYFAPPLKVKAVLSGTFGELRSNHFHSGIDIKTLGREGLGVYAAAEGYVSRIKISPYGFGKAVYLRHPNGYTTVYAHLQKLHPKLEAYVRNQQLSLKKSAVDLFPNAAQFSFEKGEQIAWSGNSGGSGGPHLHYEIRNSRNEHILNPLHFGLEIPDQRYPELANLMIYELNEDFNYQSQAYTLNKPSAGQYSLNGSARIKAHGKVGLGIYAIDRLDGASNRNGVYEIKVFLAEEQIYHFRMDEFAFSETRFINCHIDFERKKRTRQTLHKLWLEPGNKLSVYPLVKDQGLISYPTDTVLPVKIEVCDFAGNTSRLNFELEYHPTPVVIAHESEQEFKVNWQETVNLNTERFKVSFPAKAFYRNHRLSIEEKPSHNYLSPILSLGDEAIPVHRYFKLSLSTREVPANLPLSKVCVVSVDEKGRTLDYEGGQQEGNFITCRTRQLGFFALSIDTLAPSVRALNFNEGAIISSPIALTFKVDDDLSGVEGYDLCINEQWQPLYYDAKNDKLILEYQDWLKQSGTYRLKLKVADDRGNTREEKWQLIVP